MWFRTTNRWELADSVNPDVVVSETSLKFPPQLQVGDFRVELAAEEFEARRYIQRFQERLQDLVMNGKSLLDIIKVMGNPYR